ncbi:MAG: hypothetical protein KA500_03160 [Rhodoluna sp.]|nr:hypothetical protein [Rhodoluna sp.]MBP6187099.1 hypothetical protein [Rhodoluna sp.]
MFTQLSSTPSPIAAERIEVLLAKVYSVAAALLSIDLLRNALSQAHLLNAAWFYTFFLALMIAQVGSIFGAFVFGHMKIWYRAICIITLAAMVTWPLQVLDPAALPENFKPWIWWSVGFASLAAAGAFRRSVSLVFLFLLPTIWIFVRTSTFGGGEPLSLALEDTLYAFFFAGSLAVLVMFLRQRAAEVDQEFHALYQAKFERAFLDTVQSERTKINSIVHDTVVATLDRAAEATTEVQRKLAAETANDAIGRLVREAARDPKADDTISTVSYFDSLKIALERRAEQVTVKIKSALELQVPLEVAIGMAEATFQALGNSIEHAPSATKREIVLSSTSNSLKFVVLDNGPGFRVSNVPNSRMGVRLTIFKRLETLGVKANLQSAPGEGTTWVFEWSQQ